MEDVSFSVSCSAFTDAAGDSLLLTMKLMLIFAAVLVAVSAQEYYANYEQYEPQAFDENSEERHWGVETEDHQRLRRDVTGSIPLSQDGKLVGTLGQTANGGLFGEGGYQHTLINDDRGTLTGQAYGTRVLGPNKDSTHYGGKVNWNNDNTMASLDASKRLGGRARVDVEAGGRWEPFKNAEVTAGGYYSHREGRPSDYGGRAQFTYRGW